MIALLDNTVLSNFALANRPDLVQHALGIDAATTNDVWQELQVGVAVEKLPPHDWSWLRIIMLEEHEQLLAGTLSQSWALAKHLV